ncbi:DUF3592 domain-containing protein [Streptomyces ambofaciens]|uniref:DUF3592 domain-containing protein n=1 Tax=Streptomyces ambofaciens TaxID=1889 RepID=UPI000AB72F6B|nr:DUF3592 domain-containing protein [Streptomyces ambofaciens]
MAKKKRRAVDRYQLPPSVVAAQQLAAKRRDTLKPRPYVATNRTILGIFCTFLLCAGLALAFWIPPRSLVHDLRSGGDTTAAIVTGVDNNPKYVEVEFVTGPEAGSKVRLSDYAGMYPDVDTGDSILVAYDPDDPSLALAERWVTHPPFNLPAFGATACALFILVGMVWGLIRRRWILKNWPADPPVAPEKKTEPTPDAPVSLTKPQP